VPHDDGLLRLTEKSAAPVAAFPGSHHVGSGLLEEHGAGGPACLGMAGPRRCHVRTRGAPPGPGGHWGARHSANHGWHHQPRLERRPHRRAPRAPGAAAEHHPGLAGQQHSVRGLATGRRQEPEHWVCCVWRQIQWQALRTVHVWRWVSSHPTISWRWTRTSCACPAPAVCPVSSTPQVDHLIHLLSAPASRARFKFPPCQSRKSVLQDSVRARGSQRRGTWRRTTFYESK